MICIWIQKEDSSWKKRIDYSRDYHLEEQMPKKLVELMLIKPQDFMQLLKKLVG